MNCPCRNKPMEQKADAGGYAPPGFEYRPGVDDHWWCGDCAEAYELDDPELKGEK